MPISNLAAPSRPPLSIPDGPTLARQQASGPSSPAAPVGGSTPPSPPASVAAIGLPARPPAKRRRSARLAQAAVQAQEMGPHPARATPSADKATPTDRALALDQSAEAPATCAPDLDPADAAAPPAKLARTESHAGTPDLRVALALPRATRLAERPRRTVSAPATPATTLPTRAASFFAELLRVHGSTRAVEALAEFGSRVRASKAASTVQALGWSERPAAWPSSHAAAGPALLAGQSAVPSDVRAQEAGPAAGAAAFELALPAPDPGLKTTFDLAPVAAATAPDGPTAVATSAVAGPSVPLPAGLEGAHLDNAARLLPWVRDRLAPEDVELLGYLWERTQAAQPGGVADDSGAAAALLFQLYSAATAAKAPTSLAQTLPPGLAVARERLAQAQQDVDRLAGHSWDWVQDCACRRDGESTSLAVRLLHLQFELLRLRVELHAGELEAPDAQLRLCQARRRAVEMHAAAEERGACVAPGAHKQPLGRTQASVLASLAFVLGPLRDRVAAAAQAG